MTRGPALQGSAPPFSIPRPLARYAILGVRSVGEDTDQRGWSCIYDLESLPVVSPSFHPEDKHMTNPEVDHYPFYRRATSHGNYRDQEVQPLLLPYWPGPLFSLLRTASNLPTIRTYPPTLRSSLVEAAGPRVGRQGKVLEVALDTHLLATQLTAWLCSYSQTLGKGGRLESGITSLYVAAGPQPSLPRWASRAH